MLLVAFQVGDEVVHRTRRRSGGIPVDLRFQLRRPEDVTARLTKTGFEPLASVEREPLGPSRRCTRSAPCSRGAQSPGDPFRSLIVRIAIRTRSAGGERS